MRSASPSLEGSGSDAPSTLALGEPPASNESGVLGEWKRTYHAPAITSAPPPTTAYRRLRDILLLQEPKLAARHKFYFESFKQAHFASGSRVARYKALDRAVSGAGAVACI